MECPNCHNQVKVVNDHFEGHLSNNFTWCPWGGHSIHDDIVAAYCDMALAPMHYIFYLRTKQN